MQSPVSYLVKSSSILSAAMLVFLTASTWTWVIPSNLWGVCLLTVTGAVSPPPVHV